MLRPVNFQVHNFFRWCRIGLADDVQLNVVFHDKRKDTLPHIRPFFTEASDVCSADDSESLHITL